MDSLWKKAALPSIEDFAKDLIIKKNLTTELQRCIRCLQESHLENLDISDSDERASTLCYVLEAIFIHGLKDKIYSKVSSVFGNEKIPEPQFWTVVSKYSHKNVVSDVCNLNQINSEIGRGRAWLRIALNDGLVVSYIGTMLADKNSLQKFYAASAYLRDEEQSDIMKQLLEGTSVFHFEFSCNNTSLNVWNSLPLTLANLWMPPVAPQPVMPAEDVIDFFTERKNQHMVSSETEARRRKTNISGHSRSCPGSSIGTLDSNSVNENAKLIPEGTLDLKKENAQESVSQKGGKTDEDGKNVTSSTKPGDKMDKNIIFNAQPDKESEKCGKCLSPCEETCSRISSSDSVPDFGVENSEEFCFGSLGNRLSEKCGWSSAFDISQKETEADQSYDSLLQSYNKNLSKVVIGTPELNEAFSSVMGKSKEDGSDSSPEAKSPDLDFEFIPKYLTSDGADAETKRLMAILGKICPEKGLDEQNFQCFACGRPVGLIYGKTRLCNYDGYNYCYDCHINDECYIPAKIIHNWDFKQYPVCKRSYSFLSMINKDPLLDIKNINPLLYTAVEEMAQMQLLRTQLTFLRSYIFTCKESIVEELRTRVWPREYLFEHVHSYSIDDLLDVPSGALAQTLQKTISFAKNHVSGCQLCLLKGFICEVCNNPKPIYPFDVETTYHCEKCLAVYHATCMDANKFCPKCARRYRRQQLLESASMD